MSIEIANQLHAAATLFLGNVPADQILIKGFGIASVARASQGVFTVTLETPLDVMDGQAVADHAAATARIVTAQLQPLDQAGADNLQINGYSHDGTPSDTGECYLRVYRYPVG